MSVVDVAGVSSPTRASGLPHMAPLPDVTLAVAPAHIARVELAAVLANAAERSQIEEIADESYANARVLLEGEYAKTNVVYLNRDDAGRITSFFFVGWKYLRVDDRAVPSVFMGLSAARRADKGQGSAGQLYRAFTADVAEWERRNGSAVVVWFHTASPLVCAAAWRIFPCVEPRPDGASTAWGEKWVNEIKAQHGLSGYSDAASPFVLRGVAKARYNATERQRLDLFTHANAQRLLADHGIEEHNGDRLLFVVALTEPGN